METRIKIREEEHAKFSLATSFIHSFIQMRWAPTNQTGFQFQFLGMHVSVLGVAAFYWDVDVA